MAVDEALARAHHSGVGVLRLYEWERPTVSLGRNQPAAGHYSEEEAARRGFDFVRRPTGGRAVLHDRELTYAVVLPDTALGGPRGIYTRVQAALVDGLRQAGALEARQAPASDQPSPRPSVEPCFGVALPGELTLGGRKVVGSAQARIEKAVLQHGAILMLNDQSALGPLTTDTEGPEAVGGPTTLVQHGVMLEPSVLAAHVRRAFESHFEGPFHSSSLDEAERTAVQDLEEKYRSRDWTWRR
mgnify:CR=1 FL=1